MLVDVRSLAFRPENQYLYKLKGYLNKYRLVTICFINSIINPASREVKNKSRYESNAMSFTLHYEMWITNAMNGYSAIN